MIEKIEKVLKNTDINLSGINNNSVRITITGSDYSFLILELGKNSYRSKIEKCNIVVDTLDTGDLTELVKMSLLRIQNLLSGEKSIISEKLQELIET